MSDKPAPLDRAMLSSILRYRRDEYKRAMESAQDSRDYDEEKEMCRAFRVLERIVNEMDNGYYDAAGAGLL